MGSGELVLCCFQLVRERNKGHRARDPAATLMVKLTTAGEGWTWRTDGGVRQGLPLRVSLGSVDPVLGAMKDHQRLFKAKICYLYGGAGCSVHYRQSTGWKGEGEMQKTQVDMHSRFPFRILGPGSFGAARWKGVWL